MTLFVVIISQITGLQKKAWGRWVLAPLSKEFIQNIARVQDLVRCTEKKLHFRKYNKNEGSFSWQGNRMQLLDTVSWKPLYISKKNQILKPFTHVGTFQTTNLRKRFNKALLDNSSFERQCIFCNGFFKDLLQHQLFYCHGLSRERTKLFDALALLESTE